MYHSRIAGVDTEVVLQTVVAKSGARSLLTLRRTNCGGTAGVEQDVSQINLPRSCSFFLRSFDSLFFSVCMLLCFVFLCLCVLLYPSSFQSLHVCLPFWKEDTHYVLSYSQFVFIVDFYPCLPDFCTYGLVSLASYCHKLDLDLFLYIAFV